MSSYIALTYWDLVLAAIFLVLNGVLSLALNLGLERQLLIAATRMIVQLLLVGLVLKAIFAAASPWLTLGVAVVMGLFAGREILARQERRLAGPWGYGIGAGAMMAAGVIVTVVALTTQIEPDPWWSPRFARNGSGSRCRSLSRAATSSWPSMCPAAWSKPISRMTRGLH